MWLLKWYTRRLRLWETGYGRSAGWVAEWDGRPAVVLTDPRWADMFWYTYQFEVVTADPDLARRLLTDEFWDSGMSDQLVWRSRAFGEVAAGAWVAGRLRGESDRLLARGLYLLCGEPWPWDELVLWLRRRKRHQAG